ncbi:MAG TPA: S41 family peptidase [Aggregatilineaceae bacterium]|nr:S41 family peptidase [Aggregatilineaceae bacterium]
MQAVISLPERVEILSKTYSAIQLYFAHWVAVPELQLDAQYQQTLERALQSESRLQFDLSMLDLIAALRNGHSWYRDPWLTENYGQPLGFEVQTIENQWVITASHVEALQRGDIVTRVNGAEPETFFQQNRRYLPGSSEREQRTKFERLRILLPTTLKVETDRTSTTIDRAAVEEPEPEMVAHWVAPNRVGYIKIPSFSEGYYEEQALAYVDAFQSAEYLIIDVRGNVGGTTPGQLVGRLMERPYRFWMESTPVTVGLFQAYNRVLDRYGEQLPEAHRSALELSRLFQHASLMWPASLERPHTTGFTGKLILLIDGGCVSAGEDFVVPFKDNGRATLIGEHTMGSTGQPHFERFENGIAVGIGTKRAYLPDGAAFEGVGIAPDIEVRPTIEDVRAGRDVVMEAAIRLVNDAG